MTVLLGVLWLLTVPAVPAQQRLASNVVHPYGDEAAESHAVFTASAALPPNVTIPAAYDDLVANMLRMSATFRAQCMRLAGAPLLHVTVRRSLAAAPQAAFTLLSRRGDGRIEAEVEIGLYGDVVLLIAHEFEHIIEQLDGVDLVALADRPGTAVRTDPKNGPFETERAITIGQRVAREVSRAVARR